ncbi:MAG: LPS export ABC transporter periplasmic protein LptC [Candidatus Zixiibacteriota bacterium]
MTTHRYTWAANILILVAIIAGCSSRERTATDSAKTSDTSVRPDSEVRGATIYLYEAERVTAEIHATRILKYQAKDSTMAYTVNVDAFDSLGALSTTLVGDSGLVREESGIMDVFGNVVVTTPDNATLQTDYLFWDSRTEKIRTDAFVRITRGQDTMTGWGLEADEKLTRLKILNRVSGKLTETKDLLEPKPSDTPAIR